MLSASPITALTSTELVLLAIYALLGPGVALALFVLAGIGTRKLGRFEESPPDDLSPAEWPRVTVFVPVRNEEAGIEDCVRRLIAQDYPAERLRLVVANDRSTDRTGEILRKLAGEIPERLNVIDVTDCPVGWLGKPHALHVAEADVAAEHGWYLFVDSDVLCEPFVLRRTIAMAERRGYDFVSLLPRLITPTWLERLVAPVVAAVWLTTFRATDTNNDNRPASAIANGQFLLVRREPFRAVGGHAAVRDRTCEDVELARLVKADGGRVRLFMGRSLVATRMHANWPQLFNGWARNFAGTARHRPLRLAIPVVLLVAAALAPGLAVVGLLIGAISWATVALIHTVLFAAWVARTYASAGALRTGPALAATAAFPLTLVAVTILMLNAIRACFGGTVRWRGQQVRA